MSELPMFPLETVLLPDDDLPLRIFEPRYAQLVRDCLAADEPVFGVVLIAAGREVGGGENRYDVGTLARIVEHQEVRKGFYMLRCRITERIRVLRWLHDDPYPRAQIERWPDEPGDVTAVQIHALQLRTGELLDRIAEAKELVLPPHDMLFARVEMAGAPGAQLTALASLIPMGQADRYAALAAPSPSARHDVLAEALDTLDAIVSFQIGNT